jgi:hypothetical protein
MKNFILVLLLLAGSAGYCQEDENYGYFNGNVGYSFKAGSPTIAFEVGGNLGLISLGLTGMAATKHKSYEPIFIGAVKAGVNIGNVQLFFAPSFQTIGAENEQYFQNTKYAFRNGYYLGGGVTYFYKHVSLTAQQLGKEFNVNVGCFFNF